ncbi:MAG: trigger factor [Eubacteriales bacterium]|nr:trigger factor [Eubacteriales bacterium]
MNKYKSTAIVVLAVIIALTAFSGCSAKDKKTTGEDFNLSDGIAESGHWKSVKALNFVELCEYSGISIPNSTHSISKTSVQDQILKYLSTYATDEKVTDRTVEDGDTVNIDFVGTVDGVEFESGSTKGEGADVTIGVTQYIDDFLEQLIGHKPGESFDIEVTFPNDYGVENLNGKDAVFAITINHITEKNYPEFTDDFVKENFSEEYGWNTAAAMEEGIRSDLQESAVSVFLQEYIVENSKVSKVPESIVNYQQNSMLKCYRDYAKYNNMEFDDFLSTYVGVASVDELLAQNLEDSTEAAKYYLIIQAIAEDMKLTVSEEDISEYFKEYMDAEDYSEYESQFGMPYLKSIVLGQKVLDYMEENAVLE